jgi:DNA mismatch repair protein MutS2
LDENNRVLVISGPNTGGKTVALKTVGLLALAAHAGIPTPAEAAEFPLFDQVLADIGDYQSIEDNLSTFSAHITNIQSMVERVTPQSLVLLDELGAATDPQEGAALAVALVDHFLKAGAWTVASTHHLGLKAYATNTPGVLNAAVGFDEQTLQPTYRLALGIPGKSSGIAIAQRLGLRSSILDRARQTLSAQDEEVSRLLAQLHDSVEQAERMRAEAGRREEELRLRSESLAAEWNKREREKLAEMERRLNAVIARAEQESKAAIQQIADKAARREAERSAARVRSELREEFHSAVIESLDQAAPAPEPAVAPAEISEGMPVRLRSLGRDGIVRRKLAGDLFEVEVGLMRMRAAARDLIPTASAPVVTRNVRVVLEESPAAATEINVIGCTAEDACARVDKFLDTAVLQMIPRVRVIHGHGKGILRKALAEMFASHPHVARHFAAEQREGGSGATILELKV